MIEARLVRKIGLGHKTTINLSARVSCGGEELLIIGGPCSVESHGQMAAVAEKLQIAPVNALRGGVFKPRTSPYAFQGLGEDGLKILAAVGRTYSQPVVTEVMSQEQINLVAQYADVLQIGSRNMQNFELLKALGTANKPVLLKRGLSATIEEFLLAAEYIVSLGNTNVILCERGIRSFDPFTRNVLDLGAVVALRQLTHLPIIVDPSHATGKRELVADLAEQRLPAALTG